MITLRENRCFESLGIHIKAKINIPEIGRFDNFYDLDEKNELTIPIYGTSKVSIRYLK